MTQQVPFDNNAVPLEHNSVVLDGYAPQGMPVAGHSQYPYAGSGEYRQPPQEPQVYARNRAPMIDPIESAKLTPQIMFLLVLAGFKRHWKWVFPLGLVLGLLAAGVLYVAFPLQYQAKAFIQIRAVRPQLLIEARQEGTYENLVNTQFAYMRSPEVINKALEDPAVARLPIILKQRDKRGWLTRRLQIRLEGRSEVVGVAIDTDNADASEKIVNAVVEAYMAYIDVRAKSIDHYMHGNLQTERQRHSTQAQTLQQQIASLTQQTAEMGAPAGLEGMVTGLGQGESLLRDLRVEQARLFSMEAKRKSIEERIREPSKIPSEVLRQMDPVFMQLNTDREALIQAKEGLVRSLSNPNDPRILMTQRQIDAMDERIAGLGNAEGSNRLLESLYLQERMNLWAIDLEIRQQKILAEELEKKYNEQLQESASRSVLAATIAFHRRQLSRVDDTLDTIDDRLLAIRSEQRAPERITLLSKATSSTPNRFRQFTTVGMGAAMFTLFPMILGIVVERLKPRLYHVSQVRRAIPQVLIGEIMEAPISWVQGTSFRKRLARYRESVHNWCTHLLLSDPFRSCRTLSIASVAGDDGKTFLALQIAVAMAQMKPGKVLIIDGDMRVGRLHLLFGNEETGLGLADVLSWRYKPWEVIGQNEKEQNLELLTAGQLDTSPYELLGDGRFRELLDALEWSPTNPLGYALIIVVLPPIANAAESLIMAASTDSTLLCVRQRETVLAAMEDVYRKLVNTGASVDGIVVKDIPYYQMAGRDGGFADKLEQIRLSHLLQYAD